MKLTYICGFAWEPKGTVRARAFPLAEEMVRRGHEVTLIIAPYDNLAHSGEQFEANGVRVINLNISNTKLPTLARIPRDLIAAVKASQPDLVHVFKPKGFAGLAAMWLLQTGHTPVLVDSDDWEGRGGWNEVKRYPWALKQFIDFQERYLLRKAAAVTVASRLLLDRASSFRKNDREIFYVPNGPSSRQLELANELLKTNPLELKREFGVTDTPVVLYAGHFDPADDVMFFCRAAAQVAAKNHITIVFAGDGPQLPAVRSFFASNPDVRFVRKLSYPEFAKLIAASEVCAFPYPHTPIYRAKCSARIIDYMLYAKPIVSTRVGENQEYIMDGLTGLLTPPGDDLQFEQALTKIVRDAELRRRLGVNARERLLQYFLWGDRAGDNCERAYHTVLPADEFASLSLAS